MELTTAAIENELSTFLSTAYSNLLREYFLFAAPMLLSCAVVPVFVVWMLNRRDSAHMRAGRPYKAYTHKKTTPLTAHIAAVIMIPVLAIRELYHCLRPAGDLKWILFWGVLLLPAVLAVIGLSRFRVFGLLSAEAFVLGLTVFKQFRNLGAVAADMRDRERYAQISRYTLYMVDEYMAAEAMAACFAALVVSVLFAVYYYKRRFLFMPGKLRAPSCEHCGQVMGKSSRFCTCCGKQLQPASIKPAVLSLDRKLYCEKCGRLTNGSVCGKCSQTVLNYAKETVKERAGALEHSLPRGLIWGAVIASLILLNPGKLTAELQNGAARANNAYVERWNEFYDDPARALDREWLAGFHSAAEALYLVDARWLSAEPGTVPSDCLSFFVVYADASFRQMKVLERSAEMAHSAAREEKAADEIRTELAGLRDEFNRTIDLQASAMRYYGPVSPPWDILGKFGYICLDAARALLPRINTLPVSAAFMAGCILMLAYMLNGFSRSGTTGLERWLQKNRTRAELWSGKHPLPPLEATAADTFHRTAAVGKGCRICLVRLANELWLLILYFIGMTGLLFSLFRPKNIAGLVRWMKAGLTDVNGAHPRPPSATKREQGLRSTAAVITAVVIGICVFRATGLSALNGGSAREQAYLFAAKAAVSDYAPDIATVLLDICGTGALSDEDQERFYALIDRQIQADEAILAYDMTGLDDFQPLHTGLQSLCRDDRELLLLMRETIEAGRAPSPELQRNYAGLRSENYVWVVEAAALELVRLAAEAAFDVA